MDTKKRDVEAYHVALVDDHKSMQKKLSKNRLSKRQTFGWNF